VKSILGSVWCAGRKEKSHGRITETDIMLDPGDEALIMRAFSRELYPALEKTEEKVAKRIVAAISVHHAECAVKDAVQRFEFTIKGVKYDAEEAKARAANAISLAAQVNKKVDDRFNQVWGGWRVLLILGGVSGFIVAVIGTLAMLGAIHWK
jgi:hypothetical protein